MFSGVCSVCAGNKTLFLWYLSLFYICCNIGNWHCLYKLLQVVLYTFLKVYSISILLKLCTYLYILYVNFLAVHLQFYLQIKISQIINIYLLKLWDISHVLFELLFDFIIVENATFNIFFF